MLNKMSFMKKYTWVSFLVLLFIYYGYNEVRIMFNMSWWFYGFTVLVMTFSVCFDAYINRFNKEAFLNGDLIATSLQMQGTAMSSKYSITPMRWTLEPKGLILLPITLSHCLSTGGYGGRLVPTGTSRRSRMWPMEAVTW